MDIIECYRLLELTSTASLEEVKSSYRRLARHFHPDVNPNNTQAQEQFIRITEAYKLLAKIASANPQQKPFQPPSKPQPSPRPDIKVKVTDTPTPTSPPPTTNPPPTPDPQPPINTELSFTDKKLKFDTYRQLEDLIKRKSIPRAIALIEALQNRLPNDPEIRQWQALIYQHWGRQLIEDRKLSQAKAYLKKALKTDPHNKSLWAEIEADFHHIENLI